MKHPTLKLILAPLLVLALLAAGCGKKQDAAETGDAAQGHQAAEAAAAAGAVQEKEWETIEEQTEREDLAVNEPMPPVDESSAPPTVLARSALQAVKPGAEVVGEVTLYQDAYGTGLLRIENLRSSEDDGVELALARVANPARYEDVQDPIIIGELKGESGNMNYTISPDIALSEQGSLVLIQRKARVLVGFCPLTRP